MRERAVCGACQWLVGFLEPSRKKPHINTGLGKSWIAGLHAVLGQQNGLGKRGPRPAPAFGFQERQVWMFSRGARRQGLRWVPVLGIVQVLDFLGLGAGRSQGGLGGFQGHFLGKSCRSPAGPWNLPARGPRTRRGVKPPDHPKNPAREIRAYALGLRRSQALQALSTGRLYPPSPFCGDARSGGSVEASSAHVNGQQRSRQFRV